MKMKTTQRTEPKSEDAREILSDALDDVKEAQGDITSAADELENATDGMESAVEAFLAFHDEQMREKNREIQRLTLGLSVIEGFVRDLPEMEPGAEGFADLRIAVVSIMAAAHTLLAGGKVLPKDARQPGSVDGTPGWEKA